jgi:hypothetical protein
MIISCIICFLDTNLSHSPAPECDSSEQISNSGIDVASNIKEVKQPVIVGKTEITVGETQGSQQITAVTDQMPVNETKTVEKAKLQAGNGNELNQSDNGHTVSGSAEQTSTYVIVATNEIEQIKQVAVIETVVIETRIRSVQMSPALPEKTTVGNENIIGRGNEVSETGSTDVQSTVQVHNKDLIPSNDPNLPRHDENASGRSSNEISDINNGNDECARKLTNNSDPGTEEDKRSLHELNEQRTPELVQHSDEKKESEKGGNDELKIEAKGPRNNSGISDASGDGSKVDEIIGENLKTTTAGTDQQVGKETSTNNKDNGSSEMRIATISTADATSKTSKLQQSGVVQVCPLLTIPYVHSIL